MGDDSSKNNKQIYCLIKFSLFLLCHVKIINKKLKRTKIKKGNIPSGSAIELLLTLFLGTSGFYLDKVLRPLTKKFLFAEVSAFKKKFTPSK